MTIKEKNIKKLSDILGDNSVLNFSYDRPAFCSDTKMNHDKRAESGKKILREKILSRV